MRVPCDNPSLKMIARILTAKGIGGRKMASIGIVTLMSYNILDKNVFTSTS